MIDSIMIGGKLYTVKVKQKDLHKFMKAWNQVYTNTYYMVRARVEARCKLPMLTAEDIRDRESWIDERVDKAMGDENLVNADWIFYWIVWRCLDKKGWWPFRKPFRSMKHMMNSVLSSEFAGVVKFVGERVLNLNFMGVMQEIESVKKKRIMS